MPDGNAAPLSSSRVPRGLRRLVVAACAAASVLVPVLAGPASARPLGRWPYQVQLGYVALGDSFSSGVGTGEYYPDSGDCLRSPGAYAPLWASEHARYALDFAACSGATSQEILADQVGELSRNTALVTVTAGGNDVGFSTVLGTCLRAGEADCAAAIDSARRIVDEDLPVLLENLYEEIEERAPAARTVVLGYPDLFDTSGECPQSGLSVESRKMINAASRALNETIRSAAAWSDLTFVDVRAAFAGHGACSADPWLNGLVDSTYDSFHPNAKGHSLGYRPALASVVG